MATNEVSIRNWLAYVEGEAPGAPMIVILQAINDALQEFCRATGLWREKGGILISVTANEPEYRVNTPHGAMVADLAWVEFEGNELPGRTERDLERAYGSDWRDDTASKPLYYWRPAEDDVFRLYPIPTTASASGLEVWPTYQTLPDAEWVPSWLWREWREVIGDGAKARVLESRKAPWGDMELASYFRTKFRVGIGKGRVKAETGGVRIPRQVEYQTFGGWSGSG